MRRKKFVIVDHGIGNYGSLIGTLNKIGHDALVSTEKHHFNEADFLILSGVGAFPSSIKYLKKNNTIKNLKRLVKLGKPLLGICLGMHLLSKSSEEISRNEGLNFISGVIRINEDKKIHTGWNKLSFINKKSQFSIFHDQYFYFQHNFSFFGSKKNLVASTQVETFKIASIIGDKNILGVQFHPEKSQDTGIEFFKKYVEVFK